MELVQVRECDGACCVEGPRFPNEDHSDCIYRDATKEGRGCKLQIDPSLIPDGPSPVFFNMSAKEAFQKTCLCWPESSDSKIGETGGCCWQWMNDDN